MTVSTLLQQNHSLAMYLLSIMCRDQHHKMFNDHSIQFVHSPHMRRLFKGNQYLEWMPVLFDIVSNRYSKNMEFTRAYRLRPETISALEDYFLSGNAKSVQTSDCYREVFNYQVLQDLVSGVLPTNNEQDRRLASYYLAIAHRDGEHGVVYVEYQTTYGAGRRFAVGPSLQTLPKYIRAQLVDWTEYSDIDMQNAHPNIIHQLLSSPGPAITSVVENRDNVLLHIQQHYNVSRDAAKQLVLMMFYGAGLNKQAIKDWRATNNTTTDHSPFVIELRNEMKQVSSLLVPGAFMPARALSLLVQRHENQILVAAEQYCSANNIEVSVLMFDGFLVRSTSIDLLALSAHVQATTGFNIQFITKHY